MTLTLSQGTKATSNKGHSYLNACADLDHVVAHGLRPDSRVPEGRTDKKMTPIRERELDQSKRLKLRILTNQNAGNLKNGRIGRALRAKSG